MCELVSMCWSPCVCMWVDSADERQRVRLRDSIIRNTLHACTDTGTDKSIGTYTCLCLHFQCQNGHSSLLECAHMCLFYTQCCFLSKRNIVHQSVNQLVYCIELLLLILSMHITQSQLRSVEHKHVQWRGQSLTKC